MAPSGINHGGLGLFTLKNFKQGDTVALFSGRCVGNIQGSSSTYITQGKWFDEKTNSYQDWYLDSKDQNNAAGRYANDACSGYTAWEYQHHPELHASGYNLEELAMIPAPYRTNFRNNIAFRARIKREKHPVMNEWYLEMYALFDLEEYEECFAKYGMAFWERFLNLHYSRFHSPSIHTGNQYNKSMTQIPRKDGTVRKYNKDKDTDDNNVKEEYYKGDNDDNDDNDVVHV